jgi:TolA-binding protein
VTRAGVILSVCLCLLLAAAPADAKRKKLRKANTIESLENKTVEIRPGKVIANSTDLARDNYRAFLDLVSDDPVLRAEAMRRLGDLELEASEAEQLSDNIDALGMDSYDSAVGLYRQLLEAYPDYRRNDTVLYQLARAYEIGGLGDEALDALDELINGYPDTPIVDEVQFRRGEMLFARKRYNDAELAYSAVVDYGEESKFYQQSLYKRGWSQFKLAWYEDSLESFFELLDRKIGDFELKDGEERLAGLSRAEQELVEDTFRVLSISFSYLEGADSIDAVLEQRGNPVYSYVIYMNLGDLYLRKERYIDAAETYEAFVKHDPLHPKAPLLQVEVIEAYEQGGFPTLVLDGKEAFVDRYGMDGEFWVRNPVEENQAVAAHLKANLSDLAEYYHAKAQTEGSKEDYRKAAGWYRKFLAFFPDEPDSANTNFLLAEILFESEDYLAATEEYERTAYAYPLHERAAEAGYAALIAYAEHEKTIEDAVARGEWHDQYLDSGLRFANTYPDHPQSGPVLTTVAEELFAAGQFDLAIAVGQAVVGKVPPVEPALQRTAWTVIAHSNFDLANYAEAEQAYYNLRTFTPADDAVANAEIKERIASSIYKLGEQARDGGDLEMAVTHFTRLGQAVPDSSIRATAEYDAAAALITMQAWDRASNVLEQFRVNYPDSEYADDIAQKLAVTYMESGDSAKAAGEFERIADDPETELDVQREALWQAADLYKRSNTVTSEQRVLDRLVSRFPRPVAESIEARYRLLEIAEASGNYDARMARLRDIVAADAAAGAERSDRSRFLAAKASIELAAPVREQFTVFKLTQPLADSMKVKRKLMQDTIDAYTTAADYGVAEVTTAATFELAQVYEVFASDLMTSERPQNLDAAALEQYDLLLEEQVYPFEEKAIDLYKANTDRAADGVFDEWVEKSFGKLAGLMPARYAKVERSEDVVTSLY